MARVKCCVYSKSSKEIIDDRVFLFCCKRQLCATCWSRMFHPTVKLRITRCPFCKEFLFNPKITLYNAKIEQSKAYFFKDLVGKPCQVIYGRFKGHKGAILSCLPRQKKFKITLQSQEYIQYVSIDNLFLLE